TTTNVGQGLKPLTIDCLCNSKFHCLELQDQFLLVYYIILFLYDIRNILNKPRSSSFQMF
ncbi:unnamed protein product, partial [Amoebophrya sp. A120]